MNDTYNPDVLSCLANLSNDEVFTPPAVVNQMLDLLPPELFRDSSTTFLDIGCKSGVFLREIAKRLIAGLAEEIPDLQTRVDHILHRQVFGIATTELTSLVARRTLYCSKYPNCRYSASRFETVEGNIRFRNIPHEFVNGRCIWCGASEEQFGTAKRKGLETHAYEFIHTAHPEEIFNMKFDVIVGNPPYQLSDGGYRVSASPIYNMFVLNAKRLLPKYISMIIPARWYAGGKGLDSFRDEMLHDNSLRVIHDYPVADDCFSGVQIKGGVCYFLWNRDDKGECKIYTHRGDAVGEGMSRPLLEPGCEVFIRFNEAIDILHKVVSFGESRFDTLVSPRKPFGLDTLFRGGCQGRILLYENGGISKILDSEILRNEQWVDVCKVYIPEAGSGSDEFPHPILGKPFYGAKGTASTETYLLIGPFNDKNECDNVISYIKTRLFRFLVMLKKPSQHATQKVYSFVPMQDFSKPWTDEELYAKYKLTKDEISFIESMIKPME